MVRVWPCREIWTAFRLILRNSTGIVRSGIRPSLSRPAKGFRGPCTTERDRPAGSRVSRAILPPISVSAAPVASVA